MSFKLTFKNKKDVLKKIAERPVKWLRFVKDAWSRDDNLTVGEIIKNQLSGRRGNKGLNRQPAAMASKALLVKTDIFGKNVVSTMFIPASNPAKVYLPMHDKSRKGNGIIKAKNKPFLMFKVKAGTAFNKTGKPSRPGKESWVKTKQVFIPIRTNIIEYYIKNGGRRRIKSLNDSFKVLAHG